jgi:hypothetical protein
MKNSLFRGGPVATFRITVQNGGDVALHAVEVTDDRTPACSRELGSMAAGTSRTYTCTRRHVTADFTNVVTVVALSPGGQKVSDQDEAAYTFQTTLPFTG